MNNLITVYHGSKQIVEVSTFGLGRKKNDFDRGFYCTESIDLAKEWPSPRQVTGLQTTTPWTRNI